MKFTQFRRLHKLPKYQGKLWKYLYGKLSNPGVPWHDSMFKYVLEQSVKKYDIPTGYFQYCYVPGEKYPVAWTMVYKWNGNKSQEYEIGVYVRKSHRKKGIGKQLFNNAKQFLKEQYPRKPVFIYPEPFTKAGRKLYGVHSDCECVECHYPNEMASIG